MKKTLFLSAILGAFLAAPAMADVTYGGTIYTYTPGSDYNLHNATFTETTIVDGKYVLGDSDNDWHHFSNSTNSVIRYTAGGSQTSSGIQFNSLTIGGVIVDADSAITSLVDNGTRSFYIGKDGETSGSSINKSFTIKTTTGTISLSGTQEIAIAGGQTLTLTARDGITLNEDVAFSGTGSLTLDTTAVNVNISETAKTSGNGFGSIVINHQIAAGTVDASKVTTWKVNGTNDASLSYNSATNTLTGDARPTTTYYINESAGWDLAGATKVVVNATDGTVDLGSGTYAGVTDKLVINDGAVVKTSHNATNSDKSTFMPANIEVNGTGKLWVTGQDFCGWSSANPRKTITLTGTDAANKAIMELDHNGSTTMVMDLVMNGNSAITGTGGFNTHANNFTINGTNNEISAKLFIRNNSTMTISAGSALTISGEVNQTPQFNGTLTKTGAGTLTITGNINSGNITGDGAKTIIRDNTITGGTFNNVTFNNSTLNGTITLNNFTGDGKLQNALNNLTVAGTGNINLGSGEYTFNADTTLNAHHLTFSGNTEINGHGYDSDGHTVALDNGASINTGANELKIESEATLAVTNGSVTSGSIILGHNTLTNPGFLSLVDGSITTGFIKKNTGYADSANTFGMTGGTLTFTKPASETTTPEEGDPVTTTYNAIDGVTATITGGTLSTEQAAWKIDNANVSIGGVTISGTNNATLANVTLTGSIAAATGVTFDGTINYTGATQNRTVTPTTTNGFSQTETYATIATGDGAITADTAAWQINGQNATYADKVVSTIADTDTYYIMVADTAVDITGAKQLESNANATLAAGTYTLTRQIDVKNNSTLTVGTGTTLETGDYMELAAGSKLEISGAGSVAASTATTAQWKGFWMHNGSKVTLSDSGTLKVQGLTFATTGNGDATITATGDSQIDTVNFDRAGNTTITNTDVSISSGNMGALNIVGGKLTVETGTATNIAANLSATTDLLVTNGSFANLKAADVTLKDVTLDAGAHVTLGTTASHDHTLAVDSLTVNGGLTVVNANLDLTGATVTLNGNSVWLGCDLKMGGTTITLSESDITAIQSEGGLLLFNDVESLTLGGTTYTGDYNNYAASAGLTLDVLSGTLPDQVFLNYNAASKTVSLSTVPEPATATLSLLALAALASRRRRH